MITITNVAKHQIKNLIRSNTSPNPAAYLYLKGGGCNGFTYLFSILDEDKKQNKLDEIYKLDDEHNLYICGKSLMFILGTKIDYIEDLMGSRFDFTNEKITSKCGCGTSVGF